MGIQVRLQGGLCTCGHEGCLCVSGLWMYREARGSLWHNMALDRSADAPAHCSVIWRRDEVIIYGG